MKSLKSMDSPKAMFPPAIQWRNTPAFIFPLKSILQTGLGIPLGIISVLAFVYTVLKLSILSINKLKKTLINKSWHGLPMNSVFFLLIIIFISTVFVYQGSLYTKNMRYFAMMYPFLAILSGYFIMSITVFVIQEKVRSNILYTTLINFLLAMWYNKLTISWHSLNLWCLSWIAHPLYWQG